MKLTTALAAAAAICFLGAPPSSALLAQGSVAGKWAADFELGMRNVDGVVTSTGTGHARLTLEARGDSVFGTWLILDPAPPAGAPASRALKGVFTNGVLRLESEPSERRIVLNEEEKRLRMITRYELKLEGNALVGTQQQVALGGEIDPPARPFKATKEVEK